jgi:hypothetical protein
LGKAILISNQEILRAQHHIELLNKKLVGFWDPFYEGFG